MILRWPFLLPFLFMAAGLVITDLTGFLVPLNALPALLACLALSCLVRRAFLFHVSLSLFFLASGLSALTPWKTPVVPQNSIRNLAGPTLVTLEGVVLTRPAVSPFGTSLQLRMEFHFEGQRPEPVSGVFLLQVSEGRVQFERGDRVRFATRITVPHLLGLPGEFDYRRYLEHQGIAAIGRVASPEEIVLIRGGGEKSLMRSIDRAAGRLGDFIRAAVPDERTSAVMTALLIGDQKRIPADLSAAYSRAGVNHILSISGFHVGIISYFIVMATLLAATRSEWLALHLNLRRAVLLFSLPSMLFYLLLTGAAAATARSVIMLAAFVMALFAERESDPVNGLLAAAFLLVAVNPPTLFDVSFQLSFFALWGICVFVPAAMACCANVEHRLLRMLLQFSAASLAASLVTAVPVLFVFNQASLNGVIANFLIVPLLGYGAVLTGFCALPFVWLFPPLAGLLLKPAALMVEVSNRLIELFAALPVVRFYGVTRVDMLLFLTLLTVLTFFGRGRIRASLCAVLPAAAVMFHLVSKPAADGRLHVTMLSVGQGEALLLRLPGGGVALVDGGGYLFDTGRDFGERMLVPALSVLGVQRIDHLFLTHSHPDHIGGLPFTAARFPVGGFYEASPGGDGEQYDRLRAALTVQTVPVRRLAAGDVLDLPDGIRLRVLSPPAAGEGMAGESGDAGSNDGSLVFRLTYGSFSMLFAADAGFPVENRLLAEGRDLRSTVLKVAHHGSRYSTSDAFLDRVAPEAALISAGRGNRFGLPAADTLTQFAQRGIRVFRTDRDGTVDVVTDGREWSVSRLSPVD